jgi:hypothetical protein
MSWPLFPPLLRDYTFFIFGLDFLRKACHTMRNYRVFVALTPAGPLPEAAPPEVHPAPTPANRR